MGRPKIVRIKKCATCGNEFDAGNKKQKLNCSKKCLSEYQLAHKEERMSKVFDAIKEKYGVDSFFETDGFYKNARELKKEKYGDENYNNYQQIKKTLKKNHGVEHPSQTEGYSEKTKTTKKEKYGDENFNNRKKAKKTNIENLGVEHHHQLPESIAKMKETNRRKHKVDYTIQSEKSRERLIEINKEKYGSDYFFSSHNYLSEIRKKKTEKILSLLSENNLSFDVQNYEKMRKKTDSGSFHYVKYHISCNACGKEFNWSFDSTPVCRNCYPLTSISKQQGELRDFLIECGIEFIEGSRSIISPLEIDFYLPKQKLGLELNGNYFHSEIGGGKDSNYHLVKSQLCHEKGIKLLHIFEDEWMFKRNIVTSRISNTIGATNKKIYARKCVIREVSHKEKMDFLDRNHMQGNDVCSFSCGLFFKENQLDELQLVSVMTFSKPRLALGVRNKKQNDSNSMELSRFCSSSGINVIGAFERLLKFFKDKNPNVDSVYSYADCRWSGLKPETTVYSKCGFFYIHTSRPNYFYFLKSNYLNRVHRFNYNKRKLLKEFKGNPDKTEWELAKEAGLDRIWDCGSMKFELVLNKGVA